MLSRVKWKTYQKAAAFIGPESLVHLAFGVLTGVLLFAVEVVFAYFLQSFLTYLGVVSADRTITMPSWVPSSDTSSFVIFVLGVLIGRGLVHWTHYYILASSNECQKDHQRFRVISWAFRARSVDTSEAMHLYHYGVDSVCDLLLNVQSLVILGVNSLLIFGYLLKLSLQTTLVSMGVLALIAFLMRRLDVIMIELGHRANHNTEQVGRSLVSNIKNLLLLQIYGTAEVERAKIRGHLDRFLDSQLRYLKLYHLKGHLPQTLGIILICTLCAVSVRNQWMALPVVITYFYLFMRFVQGFSELAKVGSRIYFVTPAATRFARWWSEHSREAESVRVRESSESRRPEISGPIGWSFEHVNFRYAEGASEILQNFSLEVAPGSCVILTGRSGGGKSTVISLALGLANPSSGHVRVRNSGFGERVIDMVRGELLRNVGYVGPESFLVDGSIRDNLLYSLGETPSESELRNALEQADCLFVWQLPEGLQHRITDQGQGLSAGQKQRLSFARALLRKPRVLVLDEATSNLDSQSEQRMVATLARLKGQVTILAVTHREALLAIADEVRVIGESSHG